MWENKKKEVFLSKKHFSYICQNVLHAFSWSRWFQIVVGKFDQETGFPTLCLLTVFYLWQLYIFYHYMFHKETNCTWNIFWKNFFVKQYFLYM
jgi:hypothetical protein